MLLSGCQPREEPSAGPLQLRPPPVRESVDRQSLGEAVARYVAAHRGRANESRYRAAVGDFDADGREDAMVLFEHPRWCDEHGCLAAIFQSIPEGMRLISDFPSLAPPLFLGWEKRFGWRSLYAAGLLESAPALHFAGRGYFRYPRTRAAEDRAPDESRGEWLEFEADGQRAIQRIDGELRLLRNFQLFRPCGGSWHFILDATPYGLKDALDELGLDERPRQPISVEGTYSAHPGRCEPCQAFEASLTVFRVAAPGATPVCPENVAR